MSDYQQLVQRLGEYMRAGVPLVVVRTTERQRVQNAVREVAAALNARAFCYTDAKQVESLSSAGGMSGAGCVGTTGGAGGTVAPTLDVGSDPLSHVAETFMRGRNQTFMLADTRKLNDDTLYTRELLSLAHLARDTNNTLVIIAAEPVWPKLAGLGLFIDLALPSHAERTHLIGEIASQFADRVQFSESGALRLATLMRGLSEVQIVNLLRANLVRYGSLDDTHITDMVSHKERMFTRVTNITAVDVPTNLEVAGLDGLKAWLEEKRAVFYAPEELLDQYGLEPPKGILLMGVPGCGKSYSARMVADRWQLPLYRFDLGAIYDKYVGESERRMQEALDYIDNIAPCVLWIDEIEKALGADSGESDVANRILGQFLFWLQESKARVFLVATANNVDRLPPELFRKGRFSESFFIDLPNEAERRDAIAMAVNRALHTTMDAESLNQLALVSEGFSYADIHHAVQSVAERAAFGRLQMPMAQALAEQFAQTVIIAPERLDRIRAWGARNARTAAGTAQGAVAGAARRSGTEQQCEAEQR